MPLLIIQYNFFVQIVSTVTYPFSCVFVHMCMYVYICYKFICICMYKFIPMYVHSCVFAGQPLVSVLTLYLVWHGICLSFCHCVCQASCPAHFQGFRNPGITDAHSHALPADKSVFCIWLIWMRMWASKNTMSAEHPYPKALSSFSSFQFVILLLNEQGSLLWPVSHILGLAAISLK